MQLPNSIDLVQTAIYALAILPCVVIHELAHGYTALALGDQTAKYNHRLSLNPLRHIDPVGAIMMILFGFGWAKPVPINPFQFRRPKAGMAITALAGPASNLIITILCYVLIFLSGGRGAGSLPEQYLYATARLSTMMAVFNMLPIPPLDGSKILFAFLPPDAYWRATKAESLGALILMAMSFYGILNHYILTAGTFVMGIEWQIASWLTAIPRTFL